MLYERVLRVQSADKYIDTGRSGEQVLIGAPSFSLCTPIISINLFTGTSRVDDLPLCIPVSDGSLCLREGRSTPFREDSLSILDASVNAYLTPAGPF